MNSAVLWRGNNPAEQRGGRGERGPGKWFLNPFTKKAIGSTEEGKERGEIYLSFLPVFYDQEGDRWPQTEAEAVDCKTGFWWGRMAGGFDPQTQH